MAITVCNYMIIVPVGLTEGTRGQWRLMAQSHSIVQLESVCWSSKKRQLHRVVHVRAKKKKKKRGSKNELWSKTNTESLPLFGMLLVL